jgi:putative heme-binding domain-containing protein
VGIHLHRAAAGRRHCFIALAALCGAGVGAHAQPMVQHAGQYEQADIEHGARLYSGHCITCHGERGDTMPGANLGSGRFRHGESDRDLMNIVRTGIAGTAMAPSAYSDSELSAIVAYLRNMGSVDMKLATQGDAVRGRELFAGKGRCASCHRVGGEGPRFAPDLGNIGATRTAATLQRVLIDPTGALLPANAEVQAVLDDGRVITGRRLNEDTFTVQLVGSDERLISLDRARIREYAVSRESKMSSYAATLTDAERTDVVAYLLSLKGPN